MIFYGGRSRVGDFAYHKAYRKWDDWCQVRTTEIILVRGVNRRDCLMT